MPRTLPPPYAIYMGDGPIEPYERHWADPRHNIAVWDWCARENLIIQDVECPMVCRPTGEGRSGWRPGDPQLGAEPWQRGLS